MKSYLNPIKFILPVCIAGLLCVSCGNEKEPEQATPQPTAKTTAEEGASEEIKVNPAHGMPGHTCALPVGAPLNSEERGVTPVSKLPSTSVSPIRIDQTPDVNPPHGQPGHDCTVPVGAPLE